MTVITTRLTIEQRSCVLRAVHARRTEIRNGLQSLEQRLPDDSSLQIEVMAARHELECLQGATKALWGEV